MNQNQAGTFLRTLKLKTLSVWLTTSRGVDGVLCTIQVNVTPATKGVDSGHSPRECGQDQESGLVLHMLSAREHRVPLAPC